jgi:hypothetical protein
MTSSGIRIRRGRVAVLFVAVALVAIVLGDQVLPSSSSSPSRTATAAAPAHAPQSGRDRPSRAPTRPLGEADGAIPDGTTVFDDQVPGVARLDPALLSALRRAAADSGVPFVVDSGWRSRAYQAQLLRNAIAQYGSKTEAARWVASPNTSAHVSGHAIDVGSAAATWLSQHGAAYGLCQIYDNEPWHFELRPQAVTSGCPARYADPTHDPRMWQ